MNVLAKSPRSSFSTFQFLNFYIYYFRKFSYYSDKIRKNIAYSRYVFSINITHLKCCKKQHLTRQTEW